MQRSIVAIAAVARSGRALVALTAAVAIVLSLLNWSLGLVGGALFAREAGRVARRRGLRLHYPIVCAAGYAGLMTWHGGLSGSAPLKAASAQGMVEVLGPELAARAGGPIELHSTLFGSLNLFVTGGLLLLGPLLFWAFVPREGDDPDPRPAPPDLDDDVVEPTEDPPASTIERFERSPAIAWILALVMAAVLGVWLADEGIGQLDFDTVNLALWCAALVLHGRPDRFVRACEAGIRGCTGIVLQFPLYGGIMGMMTGAGISDAIARAFTGVGPRLFGVLGFLSAGLLNLFIPSGGGQWAVQGPILVETAVALHVPVSTAVMAVAYGDQWTNMLQPFWALPLLAITGVRARDIIGYTAIWMVVGGLWIATGLLLLG